MCCVTYDKVRQTTWRVSELSRPARPIRAVQLDDLALKVTKSLSDFTHCVIPLLIMHWYAMCCAPCYFARSINLLVKTILPC